LTIWVSGSIDLARLVAGLILISGAVVADKPEDKDKSQKMSGGYPGMEEDY